MIICIKGAIKIESKILKLKIIFSLCWPLNIRLIIRKNKKEKGEGREACHKAHQAAESKFIKYSKARAEVGMF